MAGSGRIIYDDSDSLGRIQCGEAATGFAPLYDDDVPWSPDGASIYFLIILDETIYSGVTATWRFTMEGQTVTGNTAQTSTSAHFQWGDVYLTHQDQGGYGGYGTFSVSVHGKTNPTFSLNLTFNRTLDASLRATQLEFPIDVTGRGLVLVVSNGNVTRFEAT